MPAPLSQEAQLQRLGQRLKELRLGLNESQATVAEAIQSGRAAYNAWESGKQAPQLWNLRALANHFGVQIGFFTDERPEGPKPKGKNPGH